MNIALFIGQLTRNVGIFYPKGANRSYHICFGTTNSRWTSTASLADASHLQQPRPVNNPGFLYPTKTVLICPSSMNNSMVRAKKKGKPPQFCDVKNEFCKVIRNHASFSPARKTCSISVLALLQGRNHARSSSKRISPSSSQNSKRNHGNGDVCYS